jgi:hypothetical protein
VFNEKYLILNNKGLLRKEHPERGNNKIDTTEKFIPDDEKIPDKLKDPDELPEDDPYENPEEEPPAEGEGP